MIEGDSRFTYSRISKMFSVHFPTVLFIRSAVKQLLYVTRKLRGRAQEVSELRQFDGNMKVRYLLQDLEA